jgi:hypothetical protein
MWNPNILKFRSECSYFLPETLLHRYLYEHLFQCVSLTQELTQLNKWLPTAQIKYSSRRQNSTSLGDMSGLANNAAVCFMAVLSKQLTVQAQQWQWILSIAEIYLHLTMEPCDNKHINFWSILLQCIIQFLMTYGSRSIQCQSKQNKLDIDYFHSSHRIKCTTFSVTYLHPEA